MAVADADPAEQVGIPPSREDIHCPNIPAGRRLGCKARPGSLERAREAADYTLEVVRNSEVEAESTPEADHILHRFWNQVGHTNHLRQAGGLDVESCPGQAADRTAG